MAAPAETGLKGYATDAWPGLYLQKITALLQAEGIKAD
jgi:hypothetical protein